MSFGTHSGHVLRQSKGCPEIDFGTRDTRPIRACPVLKSQGQPVVREICQCRVTKQQIRERKGLPPQNSARFFGGYTLGVWRESPGFDPVPTLRYSNVNAYAVRQAATPGAA